MKANTITECRGCGNRDERMAMPNEERCNNCRKKEANRRWRLEHPGAMAANAKRWRDAGNKTVRPEGYVEEQRLKKQERYRDDPEHRERAKAAAKARRLAKPEVVKAELKSWMERNRPRVRLYHKDYEFNRRNTDPEYHSRCLEHQSMWRLRNWAKDPASDSWIRHRENQAIEPEWKRCLRSWQQDHCYICNAHESQLGKRLTIEHILPRSRKGPTIKQNIVYTCFSCNYSRQNRIWWTEWRPENTARGQPRLEVTYATIGATLCAAGLGGVLDANVNAFMLRSENRPERPLFVVSSFACSSRNPASFDGHYISNLQERFLSAIIVLDREWYDRQEAVVNMLRSKMGIAARGLGARQMDVAELPADATNAFLRGHHVMGAVDAPFRIGLLDEGVIRGVGVFADHGDAYECNRLAFDGHVPGGMSRIMHGLWRIHGKRPITSFIDTRYATGDGHDTIGFEPRGYSPEAHLWVFPDRIQHQRYLSNDNKMSSNLLYFDPASSREDNIKANGVFKLWLPPKLKMLLPV